MDESCRPFWAIRVGSYGMIATRLVALLGLTWFLCISHLDFSLSQLFYDSTKGHWIYALQPPWSWIDNYGRWPAIAMVTFGGFGTLLGLIDQRRRTLGAHALCLMCVFALGPGLVINGILKTAWGRPRPAQLREFRGEYPYHSVWEFGDNRNMCRSFCSGHASMGFYLFTPAFLMWRRWPRSASRVFLGGLIFGGLMGFSRVIQGQHFITDILWSAVICYSVGWSVAETIHHLFLRESNAELIVPIPDSHQQRRAA